MSLEAAVGMFFAMLMAYLYGKFHGSIQDKAKDLEAENETEKKQIVDDVQKSSLASLVDRANARLRAFREKQPKD